jgi:hypothetical protein
VRLEALDITAPISERVARAIAEAPACASLRALRLVSHGGDGIRADGAARMAALPLAELTLVAQQLGRPGVAAIAKLSTLRALTLSDATVMADGARELATAPALSGLRRLSLAGCELGKTGMLSLASSSTLASLRALELGPKSGIAGDSLAAVLDAWALDGVRELRLRSCKLGAAGARALAASPALSGLTTLSLFDAGLRGDGAAALSRWEPRALADVELDKNGIDAEGMAALADGPLLANVRSLSLRSNKCQNDGGKALAQGKWLARLERLSLFYNWMGVGGLRAILERTPRPRDPHALAERPPHHRRRADLRAALAPARAGAAGVLVLRLRRRRAREAAGALLGPHDLLAQPLTHSNVPS